MKTLLQLFSKFTFSLSDSRIAKTSRPNGFRAWLFKTRRGDHGYLRVLAILRIFAYIGAGVTLYLPTPEAQTSSYTLPFAVASIVFSSTVAYFSIRNWPLFVSRPSKQFQVFADLICISALWALSNKLRSDLFLLYLIPIFVSIEFLSPLYAIAALCTSWLGAVLAFNFMSEAPDLNELETAPWILISRLAVLSCFSFVYLFYVKFQTTPHSEPEQLRDQIIREIKISSITPSQGRKIKILMDNYVAEVEKKARLNGYLVDQNISAVMDAALAAFAHKPQLSVIYEIMEIIAKVLECDAGTFRIISKDPNGNDSLTLTQAIGDLKMSTDDIQYLNVLYGGLDTKALLTKKTVECVDIGSPDQQAVPMNKLLSERYDLHSAISTPLTFRNIRGAVTMYRHRVQTFTKGERYLFEVLARYLALVFIGQEKKQTEALSVEQEKQLQLLDSTSVQREKRLQLLHLLALQLAQFDKEEEILKFVVDKILRDLNAEGSAIFLIRGRKLKRKAVSGIGSNIHHEQDWFYENQGIIGEVYRNGKEIVRNNAMINREFLKPESFEMYCTLSRFKRIEHVFAVPLKGKFGTFGVLRVSNKLTPEGDLAILGFSDEDVEVMLTVASTVSIALDRLQQANRSALLFNISNFIGNTRDRRIALNYIVDQARHLINVDECGIALFDEDGKVGHVIADSRDSTIEEHHLLLSLEGNESIEELRRTREPLSILDAQNDPRLQRVVKRMAERKIKSILLVPILIDGKMLGTLGMDSVEEERDFTPYEKELCKIVASLCAASLAQSELIEKISDEAVKRERQRLHGSLHDTKGTLHAGVMLPLELTQYMLQNNQATKAPEQIEQIWRCSRFIYDQINWLMEDSADPVLATEGLPAALEHFGYMLAPSRVTLNCDPLEDIPFHHSVVLYRIAQEAIANAVKHNKIGNNLCSIHVSLYEFSDHGELLIEDNGCGFNYEEK